MPKSKTRFRPRPGRARVAESAEARHGRPPRYWRKRVGWPLAIAGVVLFLIGNFAARAGLVLLPFDPHHFVTQWGGAVLAIGATMWASKG